MIYKFYILKVLWIYAISDYINLKLRHLELEINTNRGSSSCILRLDKKNSIYKTCVCTIRILENITWIIGTYFEVFYNGIPFWLHNINITVSAVNHEEKYLPQLVYRENHIISVLYIEYFMPVICYVL